MFLGITEALQRHYRNKNFSLGLCRILLVTGLLATGHWQDFTKKLLYEYIKAKLKK